MARRSTTPPSFNPRGDSVQINFLLHGVRYRRSFPSREAAEEFHAKLLATPPELLPGKPLPGPQFAAGEVTLAKLLTYMREKHWKRMPYGETAVKNATHCVNLLGPTRRVSTVEEASVESLVYTLWRSGLAGGTINRKLSALHAMLRVAYDQAWIKRIPEVGKRAEWVQPCRVMSEAEEEKLLAWATGMGMTDLCDLVVVLTDTGMSFAEALGITWEDVGEKLRVKGTGSSPERAVPISPRVREVLDRRHGSAAPGVGPFAGITEDEFLRQWSLGRSALGLDNDLGFRIECLHDTFCMRTARATPGLPGWKLISEATGRYGPRVLDYHRILGQEASGRTYPPLASSVKNSPNFRGPLPPKVNRDPSVVPPELPLKSPGDTPEEFNPNATAGCDPDELRMVVEAWPWLPEAVRAGIVAMVRAVQESGE